MTGKQIGLIFGVLLISGAAIFGAKYIFHPKPPADAPPTGGDTLPPPAGSGYVPPAPAPSSGNSDRTNPSPEPPRTTLPAPTPPAAPSEFVKGSGVWVNKNAVVLYSYPASGAANIAKAKKLTTNWAGLPVWEDYPPQFNLSVNKLGTYEEAATSGWAKIKVSNPGGHTMSGYFFVPTKDIKNTPY